MVKDIAICFFTQITAIFLPIFIFGMLVALCNKMFYSVFSARAVVYVTGIFGTPLHELSHALMCLIFRHKIVEIKLFQVNSSDGTLGYVSHSYNSKSIYQKIGNFFIGVAPILVISALLFGLYYLLLPDLALKMDEIINSSVGSVSEILNSILKIPMVFFSGIVSWQWWLFVFIGSFFALHMTLSTADVKGALSGIFFLIFIFLLVDIVLCLIDENFLFSATEMFLIFAMYMICFLSISFIISFLLAMSATIIKFFRFKK